MASGRGVTALPRWLVAEHPLGRGLKAVRLGRRGIAKRIHLGVREADLETPYLRAFVALARAGASAPAAAARTTSRR